ncbi:FAD:protein FMN transferase [Blastopirellula marina]|uniref:FAD:protein FMN transferase n=1 Tax=Blastopirellula marina DSM 3645 TaxID=314230 RepID=A3ZX10_9BACT|nr:FAD:protein FMN transferase [Blastopirellula marina]EAQ78887.1 probable thiamine biosynthesis apbe transmembrane protein [Blastopirellula marina DSM 3645]
MLRAVLILVPLLCAPLPIAHAAPLQRFESVRPLMGTVAKVIVYADTPTAAKQAIDAAFVEMNRQIAILSDYESTSEVSRLGQASPGTTPIGPELWDVLSYSEKISHATDGAFDVTVGPLTKAWRRMRRRRQIDRQAIADLLPTVGYAKLKLDPASHTAELTIPHMRLDLGGVAKGYIIDAGLQTLRNHGLKQALVDAGGDMAIGAAPPQSAGWKISVAQSKKPGAEAMIVELANCGVATSGDAYQFVEINGARYSHILDPRTGYGVTTSRTVTVFAPTAMQADAWASAISVLGPKQGFAALAKHPDHAAAVTTLEQDKLVVEKSANLDAWLAAH